MTTKNFTVDAGVEITGSGNITGANGNISISTANGNEWTFDSTGATIFPNNTLSTPGNLIVQTTDGIPTGVANWNGQGGWNQAFYSDLATTGGTGTGLTVDVAAGGGGYISINEITIHTPGTGYTNGDVITINNENNLPGTFTISVPTPAWTFDTTGVLTAPGEGVIQSLNDTVILQSKNTGTGNTFSARLGTTGGLYFETTEYPQGWLNLINNAGNANINALPGTAGAGGKSISINAGAADQTDFYTTPGGDVNITGGLGASNDGGGGGPGGNINIAAGDSADPAGHAGNINVVAGSGTLVFDYRGNLTTSGNVIMATGGQIQSGVDTVVEDGINSIALALGAQMDVFAFPFTTTTRGQLTITGDITTTEALGTWYYQSVNTNTYQLYTDSTYSTLVDASGWTPYTGGGSVAITKQSPASNIVINSNGFESTFTNNGQLNLPGALTAVGDIGTDGNITAHDSTFSGNIGGAGNFDIDGNASIGGNLFVTGNINFTGNVTQISGNSGVFYGNASTGSGALYAGKTGYTPVANTVVQVTGDLNDYIQVNLQNTNHGNTASMEIAITADDGNDTDNYIDMGIAASTWNGTQTNSLGTAVAARDGYLYVQGGAAGGNLILGTTTAGYKVKFNAGGPGAANTVATVSNVGIETSGIVSATGNVRGGNINTAGVISATSNIIGGNINTAGVISATGNITGGNLITGGAFQSASLASAGNLTFTANNANIVFNNTAYISGNANSLGRDGSIVLQPYTGAGSIFPGVLIGGAGRILAPNGSAHLVLNASDVTLQVVTKAVAIASTSTTSGGIQAGGGIGVVGNVYVGGGIVRTGTVSQPAWTTTGVGLQLPAATYTDTTSNGTVANAYIHAMGSPTLTTSNNSTFTNYATLFVDKPIASTGVTITNNYALMANGNVSIAGNITSGNINTGLGSIVSSNVTAGGYLSSAGNINLGAGSFIRSVNTLNSNTWGANGAGIIWPAITYNDINATSGTQAVSYIHLLGAPTIGFQTPVTVTNAATLYVDRPVPGSNSTLTNPWAILANGSISVTANVSSGNVNTGFISVTGNVNPGNIYTTGNITGLTSGYTIGYRDIPQVVASGNAQFGLTDAGKHYYANNTGNITLTITNNSTLAFPIGTAISIVTQANSNVLVNAISGVSLYLSGNSTTGNRVVAPYGMATLMKVATDTWFINGSGVT